MDCTVDKFPSNKAISFDNPSFYALDTQNYQIAMDTINERDQARLLRQKIKCSSVIAVKRMRHYSLPFHMIRMDSDHKS